MTRHGSRLPAFSTLDLIPETLPLSDVEAYFRDQIRASRAALNHERVLAGLLKVEDTRVNAKLCVGDERGFMGRSRHVTIGDERVCGVCHKRLGGSVICVTAEYVLFFFFPVLIGSRGIFVLTFWFSNTVVHLGCSKRKH